jgi:hypothetical protein
VQRDYELVMRKGGSECGVGGEVILLNIQNDGVTWGGGSGLSISEDHLHSLLQTGVVRKGC